MLNWRQETQSKENKEKIGYPHFRPTRNMIQDFIKVCHEWHYQSSLNIKCKQSTMLALLHHNDDESVL